MKKNFQSYLLPGLIFQSVIVAGGYGTGQELSQFFLKTTPLEGLWGLTVTASVWSFVAAVSYEFARVHKAYDYRTYFKHLLGKGWILFEIGYLLVILVVLSVVAASCGSIGTEFLNIPYNVSVALVLLYIAYMTCKGSQTISKMFSLWSLLLYIVFTAICAGCFFDFPGQIKNTLSIPTTGTPWLKNGIEYASYNLGLIPAVFFSLRTIKSRQQAIGAGLLTGPLAILPGVFLYLAMLSDYPLIIDVTIPSAHLLKKLDVTWLTAAFTIVLLGTLIETGVGLIHAFNQRVNVYYEETATPPPPYFRIFGAAMLLVPAAILSQFSLSQLISTGYRGLTYLMLAIFIIPLMTIGFRRIYASSFTQEPRFCHKSAA